MADDNDPPKNPFIRWKQHVDAHIGMTLHGLLGIPNMVSKNLNIRQDNNSSSNNDSGSGPTDAGQPPSSPSNPPPSSSSSPPPPSSSQTNSRDISSSGNDISTNTHNSYTPPLPAPTGPLDNNDDGLDGVDAAQLLAWHKFVYYSPYSPLKLQQQQHLHLLPPPVPQDVPFGADPFAFTYADAFEDLLRASSGRPLLDLADRSYRNLRYQMRYGSAIEPPYAFFHRMHSQRLLDAYFPRTMTEAAAAAVGSAEEKSGAVDTPNDDVVRAVTALAERDRDLWREQRAEEEADKHSGGHCDDDTGRWDDGADEDDENDEDDDIHNPWLRQPGSNSRAYGYGGSLFGELDRVFRVLGRIIDEDTGAAAERAKNNDESTLSEHKNATDKAEADAEDELYNAVRSAYSSAERSLGTLIKTFSGGFDSSDRYSHSSSSSSSFSSTTESLSSPSRNADGRQGETIETTEEHVDAFGNRHVKTVVQRLDADGNEVARETRYTIRSQSAQEAAAFKDSYDDSSDEENRNEKNTNSPQKTISNSDSSKGSGWFWK
ncbi:hypothetical protein SBRCBS47491_005235 [Sporothrix bragantina]|uniref:Uncharacterized protein n=1 Tax=Sporothrix bragantina TaxID=671064 RepID=A0ABP0BUW3_9PEZI